MPYRSTREHKSSVLLLNGIRPSVSAQDTDTHKSVPTLLDKGREEFIRHSGYDTFSLFTDWRAQKSYDKDLMDATAMVGELVGGGKKLTIVADSAGVSKTVNIIHKMPNAPINALLICGRVREGDYEDDNPRSLVATARERDSELYLDSVRAAEKNLEDFDRSITDRLYVVNCLRDTVVPRETTEIEGARTTTLWSLGHSASVLMGSLLIPRLLSEFDNY